jgi:lipopolysaccharide export system protein LptC
MSLSHRVWWVWDRLSIYLPAVLMALLAMAAYWLLQATPPPLVAPEVKPEMHLPDSTMRRFSARTYGADKQLRSEVFGQEARHYPDDNSTEIDQARLLSHSPERGLITATAERAWANAAHTEYQLRGHAIVVREATTLSSGKAVQRLEFHGEHLNVFSDDKRVVSDLPVRLVRGSDTVTADRLDYNDRERVALLTGRVRAVLVPTAVSTGQKPPPAPIKRP